jgi:predicted transcriptional regulator
MAVAISLAHGKSNIDIETYEIIKRVARDLIPVFRLEILNHFWTAHLFEDLGEWQTTKEVAEALNMPPTTAKLHLEDLMVVGLLNRDRESEEERAAYIWQLSATAYDHMNGSEIFEQTTNEPF